MSELREVLLCEDCLGRHEDSCGTLGCECWCRAWEGVAIPSRGTTHTPTGYPQKPGNAE